jgi:F-type H+-transporting ATPase subunit alpha
MKLELAQFAELAAFSQFGSELDAATAQALERGKRTQEMLKQGQYQPLNETFEILSIWSVTNGYLDNVPLTDVGRFERELHAFVKRSNPKLLTLLASGEKVKEEATKELEKTLKDFKKVFK